MKYSKEDILAILISQYKFQIEFDPVVVKGMDFNFENSIFDWRDACDLVEPKKLAKIYHKEFNIDRPLSELEDILINENTSTVLDFCEYLSKHAERETIEPLKLLGQNCKTALIFRTLKQNLTQKGVDTTELKPSSEINPFFLKYGGLLFEEVNKIAPGTLSTFEYKTNKLSRIGRIITFIGLFLLIAISWNWSFSWWLILPLIIGAVLIQIGSKKQPEKLNIGGFNSFRELIYGMEDKLSENTLK